MMDKDQLISRGTSRLRTWISTRIRTSRYIDNDRWEDLEEWIDGLSRRSTGM